MIAVQTRYYQMSESAVNAGLLVERETDIQEYRTTFRLEGADTVCPSKGHKEVDQETLTLLVTSINFNTSYPDMKGMQFTQ